MHISQLTYYREPYLYKIQGDEMKNNPKYSRLI